MDNPIEATCCCHTSQKESANKLVTATRKTSRAIPSTLLSLLIAFFPKCPVCWAMYMSMFGGLGLARLPYLSWLFPVLLCFLGLHLWMLYKKSPRKGYLPFLVSLTGAIAILSGRTFFPLENWILLTGMALIISGSLLNGLSSARLSLSIHKNNNH